eukprot:TRINITY_DN1925_c0_g1_i1.p1 TRINITY_DN1925_c0_g1~~TRINITY_DN1925_c0_g1_i1.p1  ORF type:complete len:210 (-),score=30.03 TRINITY_DN1925_c0_g1_i1:1045-1674(-)
MELFEQYTKFLNICYLINPTIVKRYTVSNLDCMLNLYYENRSPLLLNLISQLLKENEINNPPDIMDTEELSNFFKGDRVSLACALSYLFQLVKIRKIPFEYKKLWYHLLELYVKYDDCIKYLSVVCLNELSKVDKSLVEYPWNMFVVRLTLEDLPSENCDDSDILFLSCVSKSEVLLEFFNQNHVESLIDRYYNKKIIKSFYRSLFRKV